MIGIALVVIVIPSLLDIKLLFLFVELALPLVVLTWL